MRVLMVEDDLNIARQVRDALDGAGYVVDVANTGEDGPHLGDTEPYDTVILDLGLPMIDGNPILERWRRANVGSVEHVLRLPVLVRQRVGVLVSRILCRE